MATHGRHHRLNRGWRRLRGPGAEPERLPRGLAELFRRCWADWTARPDRACRGSVLQLRDQQSTVDA